MFKCVLCKLQLKFASMVLGIAIRIGDFAVWILRKAIERRIRAEESKATAQTS